MSLKSVEFSSRIWGLPSDIKRTDRNNDVEDGGGLITKTNQDKSREKK